MRPFYYASVGRSLAFSEYLNVDSDVKDKRITLLDAISFG
jgi:hypothetical protein